MNVCITHYREEYAQYFKSLNEEWLEDLFSIEEIDKEVLSNPQEHFIANGGFILFATLKETVVGCLGMKKLDNNGFELTKMAVQKKYRGNGIGDELIRNAIFEGILKKAKYIELSTSSKLENAIHLYEKYGFVHMPFLKSEYKRSDVYMVLTIK